MNTRQFGWPVIIAAGLHGALFFLSSEAGTRPADAPGRPVEVLLPPLPEPLFTVEPGPDVTEPDPGGPVSQCHLEPLRLPERMTEAGPDAFQVRLEPSLFPTDRVTSLEDFTGLPPGPGLGPGGFGLPQPMAAEELDRVPRALFRRPPAYSEGARRGGRDGTVTVEFVVDPTGRVVRAGAVRWTNREFVEPAVRAVQDWRFEPGTVKGRRVSFRMAVPIHFNATP